MSEKFYVLTCLKNQKKRCNFLPMTIYIHEGDIPEGLSWGNSVAVDTETMGLNLHRDRLCLVQLSSGNGDAHLVKFTAGQDYHAPRLCQLMSDPKIEKLFHFARFDIAALKEYLQVDVAPIYCTKIASKLVRTFTDRHSLKELCREILGVELSKQFQSSDWGQDKLSDEQKLYAANDVLYLHRLREKLDVMLARENRREIAQACFDFLPHRAALDLLGWPEKDIFSHES